MKLVYKGDGDYNVELPGVVIELSYDGSDYAVGDWLFWGVLIDGQRFGGTQDIGPGTFTDWLEEQVRAEGHLPNEPDESVASPREASA